jgi:DNA-binding response OmpR family regulator
MAKVIVIDNAPHILLIIKDKLEEKGHHVITLRESSDAINIIRREQPELIILDWMMPEISGINLCKLLKSDRGTAHIPIFMLTGRGDIEDEQQGLRCGVQKYITKPFSPRLLLKLVEDSIGKKSS